MTENGRGSHPNYRYPRGPNLQRVYARNSHGAINFDAKKEPRQAAGSPAFQIALVAKVDAQIVDQAGTAQPSGCEHHQALVGGHRRLQILGASHAHVIGLEP
jgi:hypothetical protein